MGGRMKSYNDLGGGGKQWLKSWKEKGALIGFLHREPPFERDTHNWWIYKMLEEDGKPPQRVFGWQPQVCWESDEALRKRRFEEALAEICPVEFFLDHLELRDDIAGDDVIFEWKAGRESKSVTKMEALGRAKGKDAWKGDITAKHEYILAVAAIDQPDAFRLTNEKWSLGQELVARIKRDKAAIGEDEGDPERTLICYSFEYNKDTQKYSVSRFPEGADKIGKEKLVKLQELWKGPSPDATHECEPSSPYDLRKTMEEAATADFPWDDIFAKACKRWDNQAKGKDAEKEKEPEQERRTTRTTKPREEEKTEPKEPAKETKKEEPAMSRPTRQVRTVKKEPDPPPPPKEPEPEIVIYECASCGGDFPSNVKKCPKCGVAAADDEPEPEPAKGADRERGKKPPF